MTRFIHCSIYYNTDAELKVYFFKQPIILQEMDNYLELSNTSLKQDGSDYMPLGPTLLSSSANTWQRRRDEREENKKKQN